MLTELIMLIANYIKLAHLIYAEVIGNTVGADVLLVNKVTLQTYLAPLLGSGSGHLL